MKKSRATLLALLLSLLFLMVYGGCNWITSQRQDVGTLCFSWEHYIPFVPLMIIPYMSIDLFFLAAPFVCTSREEQRVLAWRICFAILVAGAFFLMLPLHLVFERPMVTGWLGAIFNAFRGMDQPYNLLPSLHITLRTILAALYARHTRGVLRLASHIWFSLVGLSTVLTYQHQVPDVIGGFVLAGWAFYLIREQTAQLPVIPNRRVGSYYALGAAALALAAWWLNSWALLLLWPAIALIVMAGAYFGLGPGVYRKTAGRLPLSTRFVLGPCLWGQQLSLLYYQRQCRPWDKVTPNVWIGWKLSDRKAAEAVQQGVSAVLDLTAEFDEARPFLAVEYLNLPVLDLTAPTQEQLKQMARFIARQAGKGVVYVHCKIGYSRTAAAVGAYLLQENLCGDVNGVVEKLRGVRPSMIVRPEIRSALSQFKPSPAATAPVSAAASPR